VSAARSVVGVVAVLGGAAIGAVVGLFSALLIWIVLSDSSGADEPFIGGLVMAVLVVVPVAMIAGAVIAWRLSRSRSR
jgi:hypothetical protein